MAISLDGKKLFVAESKEVDPIIGVIDLAKLVSLPSLPAPFRSSDIAAGSGDRLFITGYLQVAQIDSITGAVLAPFPSGLLDGVLQISPDLKTLYLGSLGYSPGEAYSIDVTSNPVLLQTTPFDRFMLIGPLKLSHDGTVLCASDGGNDRAFTIPSNDLTATVGQYVLPDGNVTGDGPITAGPVAFSPDDKTVFVTAYYYSNFIVPYTTATLDLFDAATAAYLRKISASFFIPHDMVVDSTGQYLFAASQTDQGASQLRVYSTGEAVAPTPAPKPKSLLNVSTRLESQTGENVLIGGFIISGTQSKQIMARGIGPSLPLEGALSDPVISLYDQSGKLVGSSDNWNSDRAGVLFTGLAPADEHEAALVVTLPPGPYTVILSGADGGAGVALVEVYDLTPNDDSALANISTRGTVGTGDNVMIGGFIIGADQATKVLIRAIGPSLAQYGIAGALPDPALELHGADGDLLFANDNWRSTQQADIISTTIPPSDDRESAIVATLTPGAYTAIVRGHDDTTGVGLVEVYNLDSATSTAR